MGMMIPGLESGALKKAITVTLSTDDVSAVIDLGLVESFEIENDEDSAGIAYLITADANPDTANELYPIRPGTSRLIIANNRTLRFKREAGLAATVRVWRTGPTPAGA